MKTNWTTIKTVSLLMFFTFLCFSCKREITYKSSYSVYNHWYKDSIYTFRIDKPRYNQTQNIYFLLRNNEQYNYSNIYFFVTFEDPRGNKNKDTLQYRLASSDGHWLGKGIGSVKENLLLYRENENFADSGVYKISIRQAMRNDTLIGIENIGLIIQKTKAP